MTFSEASSRTLKEEAFPAPSVNPKKHAPGPEKMNSKCGNSKISKEIKRSRAVQVATPQRAKRDCFQPSVLLGGGGSPKSEGSLFKWATPLDELGEFTNVEMMSAQIITSLVVPLEASSLWIPVFSLRDFINRQQLPIHICSPSSSVISPARCPVAILGTQGRFGWIGRPKRLPVHSSRRGGAAMPQEGDAAGGMRVWRCWPTDCVVLCLLRVLSLLFLSLGGGWGIGLLSC